MTRLDLPELDGLLAAFPSGLALGSNGSRSAQRARLRDLYQLLIRAAASTSATPVASLATAADLLSDFDPTVVDAMKPRPRAVFRLLRAAATDAAWGVAAESAVGVIDDGFRSSTATGARRTAWPLPLLTRIDGDTVYAALPGFRDPRFDAPDDCYEITDLIRLRPTLDDIEIAGDEVTFGGTAALDHLVAGQDDDVRVVFTSAAAEILVHGRRHRRPDLAPVRTERHLRREWAGWSARLDLTDPRLPADWVTVSVEIEHDGLVRRGRIGRDVTGLAAATLATTTRADSRTVEWARVDGGLRLRSGAIR
jgi:hypothetical protein